MTCALLLVLSNALAGDRPLYDEAVRLIERHYLRLSTVDPELAFLGAAEAAESAVPWLIVDSSGSQLALHHGGGGPFARLERAPKSLGELPAALERLEDAILAEGSALPDDVELSVELLRGTMEALDRPSVVMAGDRLERFDERIRGTTSGVGARIAMLSGELTVRAVVEDSPAASGGLESGDVILRIDGASTVGMTVSRAVDRIRGPEGTQVKLVVRRMRGGAPRELELTLTRAELVLPNVSWEREGTLGWIRVDHFSDRTESLMRQALGELEAEGPLSGIMLDLRGNAGGSMIQSARAADLFLEEGLLVRTVGRGGAPVDGLLHEVHARPGADRLRVPLIVLVDDQSASASEILAGALQSHGRALLLGDRTYGKGTVQKIFTLRAGEDPVRIKLTVAEYRLEGDRPVADVGLAPDLWVRTATFGKGGVSLPAPGAAEERALQFVDEGPGWRTGEAPPHREDPLRMLAGDVLRAAASEEQAAMLAALDAVLAERQIEEERRLMDAFAARGIDWSAGGAQALPVGELYEAGPLPVQAELSFDDPPAPGARVHLTASVRSVSDLPLQRARLRLVTEQGNLPWDDVVLPIGALLPGEARTASATVSIPLGSPQRQDALQLRFEAEGMPTQSAGTRIVELAARPTPALRARARLLPKGDHHEVAITLDNEGQGVLTGVRARFAYPDAGVVELLEREVGVPAIGAGESASLRIGVKLAAGGDGPVPLDLIVDAEQLVEPLRLPLALDRGGDMATVAPPTLTLGAPLSALPGPLTLVIEARDDQGLADLVVWQGSEKIAWATGAGRRMRLEVPVQVPAGLTVLSARVHDHAGVEVDQRVVVRGVPDGDAAAQGQAEPTEEPPRR